MPRLDLDAFLAERNADPLVITFGGKDYGAPAEVPWVAVEKAQEIEGKQVDMEDIGEIIDLMLGGDAWAEMREGGIGFTGAMKIMNALLDQAFQDLPGDEDPKAVLERVAEEQASRSQDAPKTSTSSRRTSNGSGGTKRKKS